MVVETTYIWMSGKSIPWKEAKVHVLTHALHYGSGVFEGIRCYNTAKDPAVFRLRDHLTRLYNSAATYFMEIPFTIEELQQDTIDLIKLNGLKECYIRPIVYRGYSEMGLNPLNSPVEVAIAVWPWGTYLGEDALTQGVKTMISSYRRIPPSALPHAKATGQYLNSSLAKIEALRNGCDEAIMLDLRGFVAEGPGENIFTVKEGVIYTPSLDASILPGITRDSIITIARNLGYKVVEGDLTLEMLYSADEAFFTGTAAEVALISEVDDRKIGKERPYIITSRLQKVYLDIVKGLDPIYERWLTYVK